MWKRRRTWLLIAALTGVALAVYFEPSHCVRGWLWGEAFFDGRPTSYWRCVVESDLQVDPDVLLGREPAAPPTVWQRCKDWIGYKLATISSAPSSPPAINRRPSKCMWLLAKNR
jgi:hypothetical protein